MKHYGSLLPAIVIAAALGVPSAWAAPAANNSATPPSPSGASTGAIPGAAATPVTPGVPPVPEDPDEQFKKAIAKKMANSAVAIVVPVSLFFFIVILVGTVQYLSYRKDQNRHKTLQAMVEKGANIPPELITPRPRRLGSDLRRGLILVLAGVGITLALLIVEAPDKQPGAWSLGLIPTLIGVGYLLAWRLEGKHQANGNGGGFSNGDAV